MQTVNTKKRCRAENAECRLETGVSIFEGSLKFLRCELCCTEPGFCRECICLLCCKALKSSLEENFTIRCMQIISKAGICGHAVHLSCALDSQMAGVVKLHGIDMEYLCRRCDQKTDLKDVIVHLVGGMTRVNAKPYAEKMLKLAIRTIQGSERGGRETKLLERSVHWALERITKGEDIQTLLEAVADGSDSNPGDEQRQACKGEEPHGSPRMAGESSPAELGQGFRQEHNAPSHSSTSLEFAATGHVVREADAIIENFSTKTLVQSAEINGTSIAIQLDKNSQAEADFFSMTRKGPTIRAALASELISNGIAAGHEELEDNNGPLAVDFAMDSPPKQAAAPIADSSKAVSACDDHATVEAPVHAPEIFDLPSKVRQDSQYERDIQDALQKMRNRQLEKYALTEQRLVAKKKEVMDQYHQLNSARSIFATQAASMSEDKLSTLQEKIVSQAACLEKEHVLLEELLQTCSKLD